MQVFIHDIDVPIIQPLQSKNIMFLDIETNGLSHKHKLVIIGLVIYTPAHRNGKLIQLFNDDFSSERDMLDELRSLIKANSVDYFVSFNGNAFDFPFLNARYNHYKIDYSLPKAANIDILRIARVHQKDLGLIDLKLKTVEQAVGINRTDVISGKDSIVLYDAYLESRSESLKATILLHNYDDLANMVPLLDLTKSIDFNFPDYFTVRGCKIYLSSAKLRGSKLSCTLELSSRLSIMDLFYETSEIRFECLGTSIALDIDCIQRKDPMNNNYYFIYSMLVEEKPFDAVSDDVKRRHLAFVNKEQVKTQAAHQVFRICETILDILMA